MEVNVKTVSQATVIEIAGDLDGNTAPQAQAQILQAVEPGAGVLLDLSGVGYMSSAGLRMMLTTYRSIVGKGGQVVMVGLSGDLKDTMEMTGFLDLFKVQDTVAAGLAALA